MPGTDLMTPADPPDTVPEVFRVASRESRRLASRRLGFAATHARANLAAYGGAPNPASPATVAKPARTCTIREGALRLPAMKTFGALENMCCPWRPRRVENGV
jgi:hypothetical protein